MTDDNQPSPPPVPENPAPIPTVPVADTPTISAAPETGTAESAAGSPTSPGEIEARKDAEPPAPVTLKSIITDALAEIGKIEHFAESEIEALVRFIAAKV